ncbi:hypothetical protein [Brevibacillus laterosporus]|uniref:hypothetical protein n=1 Tax=Brevibacillus laterosporus TaxID=1465 RepID=UPI000EB12764|nr:hypothetical protein [Brevibacillus laterosporus]AYK07716.1 hypothetical protein D8Z77_15805 [Brevibacillus laterosporus]
MSNLLSFDISNLQELTSDQLQNIAMMALQAQVTKIQDVIEETKDESRKTRKEVQIIKEQVNDMRDTSQRTLEVAVNSLRVKEPREGWIGLNAFGKCFAVTISGTRMGRLFRVIGLALSSTDRTTPYKQYLSPEKYVVNRPTDHGPNYKWNYKRCLHKLDTWLQDHDLFEEFYSICDEREMENFIDELHDRKVKSKRVN